MGENMRCSRFNRIDATIVHRFEAEGNERMLWGYGPRDVEVDEPVLLAAEQLWLIHDLDEPLTASITAYALAEIVSEKLRALL